MKKMDLRRRVRFLVSWCLARLIALAETRLETSPAPIASTSALAQPAASLFSTQHQPQATSISAHPSASPALPTIQCTRPQATATLTPALRPDPRRSSRIRKLAVPTYNDIRYRKPLLKHIRFATPHLRTPLPAPPVAPSHPVQTSAQSVSPALLSTNVILSEEDRIHQARLHEIAAQTNEEEEDQALEQLGIRQYRMIKLLGEGGSGTVHLAKHCRSGKVAAIKSPKYKAEIEWIKLESVLLIKAGLHPNIIGFEGFFPLPGSCQLVLEPAVCDLAHFFVEDDPVDVEVSAYIVKSVCLLFCSSESR